MNTFSWREWMQPRPMLALALAAGAGILIADLLPLHSWTPFVAAGLAVIAAMLAFRFRSRFKTWPFICITLLAICAHVSHLQGSRDHPWRLWLQQQQGAVWVEAEGTVEQPLNRSLPGFEEGEAMFRVCRLQAPQRQVPEAKPGYFALRSETLTELPVGHYVFSGWMSLPAPADNPGQFDRQTYHRRLGLVGELRVSHLLKSEPAAWDLKTWLVSNSEHCRAWVGEVLSRHLPADSKEYMILLAMALGATDTATPEMQIPFRLSGTLHIFAVSGLHVGIIGVIFWCMLKTMGVSRGSKVLLIIPLVFGYAFITGLRPSALRAAVMTSALLLGTSFNRRSDLLNSLGTAAIILLAVDTQQLFLPGFQLSFGVLASIALFHAAITQPLRRWIEPDPFFPKPLLSTFQRWIWHARRSTAGLLTMSASAWLGSIGLMLHHFHALTPVGLLANLLLIPLAFLVLGTVMLQLCFFFIGPLHGLLSSGSFHLAKLTLTSAQLFSAIPGGNVYVPSLEVFPRPPAQLTVLRLPGADAAQHLHMAGRNWLFDCGSERQFPFILQPYLHHQGINRLDQLILSHEDTAHRGATPLLQQYYGLHDIAAPFPRPTKDAAGRSVSWRDLTTTQTLPIVEHGDMPATAEVLFPPAGWHSRRADDRALIMRLHIGRHRLLWCNDAGFKAEKYLLAHMQADDLRSDVVIRNQHPDDFSMLPEFLDAVRPRVLVSSNATFPVEQQLRSSLRHDCEKRNIILFDQQETGAVIIRLWPDHMELQPFRDAMPPVVIGPLSK